MLQRPYHLRGSTSRGWIFGFLNKINVADTSWTPVTGQVYYDFDLQTSPLQIKTDSAVASMESIAVFFYTADGEESSAFLLTFGDEYRYFFYSCSTSWVILPEDLIPTEQNKIWTITESEKSVQIMCNQVEVLVVTFSDLSAGCVATWSRDTVKILFRIKSKFTKDSASDGFRAKPGTTDNC